MDFIPQDPSSDTEDELTFKPSFKTTIPLASVETTPNFKTTSSKTSANASTAKSIWCNTIWTNLSMQAKKHNLPSEPYFAPSGRLSKEVNEKMWKQVERLFDYLGPEKARYATPIMTEFGEVTWHSFIGKDNGIEVEIYNK